MSRTQKNNSICRRKDSSTLYLETNISQVPLIYRPEYNIKLCKLEQIHPFDSGKWGNIVEILKKRELLNEDSLVKPLEATKEDLTIVHSSKYLKSLKWSAKVAQITEVFPIALLPNFILQKSVLRPFRFQTGGSILGGKLAMEQGWAINIGGGFHHCSSDRGGGFCAYADITLSIHFALNHFDSLSRIMIVDLDAHQGNGHERDFMDRRDIFILDIYNKLIYPKDHFAKKAISRKVELLPFTEDEEYLEKVNTHLEGALNEFHPQLIVYNAGTDILKADPLGLLDISAEGIVIRDEIVFSKARERNLPILMLTSGGYQRCTASVIANSIANLHQKQLISLNPL